MGDQEVPRDLTFVSLVLLVFVGYLVFSSAPNAEVGIRNALISIPTSMLGVALYAAADRMFEGIKFKLPRTWQEWILLYFLGLIVGGVILLPVRLLLGG